MPTDSPNHVNAEDVRPLLALARDDPDSRIRDEALAAAAALPLDSTAREHVGELVIERLKSESPLPPHLIAPVGRLIRSAPELPTPVPASPGRPDLELVAAVDEGLLTGQNFPEDLTGLSLLPEDAARGLLSKLIAELVSGQDEDDEVLAAATGRLRLVLEALPVDVAAELPLLEAPVPSDRANWVGGLLALAPPGEVLASVYDRLNQVSDSGRLGTVRAVRRIAFRLGHAPEDWPQPTSRPAELAALTGLVATVQPTFRAPMMPPLFDERIIATDELVRVEEGHFGAGEADCVMDLAEVVEEVVIPDVTREAYARLDAPERVAPGEVFELRVGLAEAPVLGVMQPAPFTVPTREFQLEVQLHTQGFDVLGEGELSQTMAAGPEDPYPYEMLRLRAIDDETLSTTRVITAAYSVDGSLIGVASRSVLVGDAPLEAPVQPPGATWVLPDDPELRPDLEIVIAPGNDQARNTHTWSYRSPDPEVQTVANTLYSRLEGEEEYAQQARQGIEDRENEEDLPEYLRGVGKTIGKAVPAEIWAALRAVTRRGKRPTVLLATWDPYVPWELAREPKPQPGPEGQTGSEGTDLGPLGAQAVIGRWIYGAQTRTPVPPARVHARTMAVVSGQYKNAPLPQATKEAAHLTERYKAEGVQASLRPVLDCLARPTAPHLLHLAVHGRFDATGTAEGILMDDERTYLNPTSVLGVEPPDGTIGVRFVFLNACQIGQQRQLLGQTAGMVASFLAQGVGGAIAPLWKVNDGVARAIAVDFYKAALTKSVPPAEYMRKRRADAQSRSGAELSTPLGYLFFGHPLLTIDWNPQGADHDELRTKRP